MGTNETKHPSRGEAIMVARVQNRTDDLIVTLTDLIGPRAVPRDRHRRKRGCTTCRSGDRSS